MELAFETVLTSRRESQAPARESEPALNITVVFTSVSCTLAALRDAGELAIQLRGRITLLVPQVVPYPLPLSSPPVLVDWNERRFHVIASQSSVDTRVRVYLCRDRIEMLRQAIGADSIVILAGVKRWWPTSEKRLARQLRRAGHKVIFKEME